MDVVFLLFSHICPSEESNFTSGWIRKKTRGGELGLLCLWRQKKNAFPWFSCFPYHLICFSGICMAAAMWKTTRELFSFIWFLFWYHRLTSPGFPPCIVKDPTISEIWCFGMTKILWVKNYIKLFFDFHIRIKCRFHKKISIYWCSKIKSVY